MDSFDKLERRKAELKAKIEQERTDLKKTFLEVREEIEPSNLLKKAVGGMFTKSKSKSTDLPLGAFDRLPPAVTILTDLLIKDPRMALAVKLLTPLALKAFPRKKSEKTSEEDPILPPKATIYGGLRRGVAAIRSRLKGNKPEPEPPTEPTEN